MALWCLAASNDSGADSAEGLVKEALHRELYGLHSDRNQLLAGGSPPMPRIWSCAMASGFPERRCWLEVD